VGLVNAVLVPALAVGLAHSFGLRPALAMGLVLVATSPGGPTGGLYTINAGADVSSAALLLAGLLLASAALVPLTVASYGEQLGADAALVLGTIAVYQLLPLAVAVGLRRLAPAAGPWLARVTAALSNVLLVTVVVMLVARHGELVLTSAASALLPSVLLVTACLVLGYRGDGRPMRRAMSLVSGVRNISLALLIARAHFPDPATTAAVLAAGLVSIVLPGAVSTLWAWRGGAMQARRLAEPPRAGDELRRER
jgi:BASS family bile acid:Na+ symporter